MLKVFSLICSIFGIIISSFGLIAGLSCIGKEGFAGIGVVFIPPSAVALIILILDILVTIDFIKRGLFYSCLSSLIKILALKFILPSFIYDYTHLKNNYTFFMIIISSLIIVTIPSVINIVTSLYSKKK